MSELYDDVQPTTVHDILTITRMTFDNMTGADRQFTEITRNPIGRWLTFLSLPAYLSFSGRGYKVVREGSIAGCAFLHFREISAYVYNVNVNHRFRRQGIARHLMKYLELVAKDSRRWWMALQVDRENQPAQRLYEQLGYRALQPYFLYRPGPLPIHNLVTTGLTVESILIYHGRGLYNRYWNIEQQAGDLWALPVIDDYDVKPSVAGSYYRCNLNGEEIGCARLSGTLSRPWVGLALKPAYWGHITTGGLIKLLLDEMGAVPEIIEVHLGSSAHYEAAARRLSGLGFQTRIVRRLLMLKSLDGD
ncbi:MAG: GNAT family N-acetyltransferase [Chloroflexota bacterium]|jgi:ribosomal protein S18 acetylase RimI-like enzyme